MSTINIAQECGCFKRSDLQNNITMESKDEALLKTLEMRDTMNDDFCAKHTFKIQEVENNFVISMHDSTSSACCGGSSCGTH